MSNAKNDFDRVTIIQYLLEVWNRAPELRLGQLLEAACTGSMFYRDDFRLVVDLEEWVNHHRPLVEDKLET